MINEDMVVGQALQGATPPTWQVLRAKASYFFGQIGIAVALLLLGVGGFLGLTGDPNSAYGYGLGGTVSDSVFTFWRIVDFVGVALLVFGGIYYLVKSAVDWTHRNEQVLVLMPEGFVINSNTRAAYAYAAMQTLRVTVNRGTTTIRIQPKSGAKNINVVIDGRFGKPKQITQTIATARNQFAAAQVAAQQPQPTAPAQQPLASPQQ